MRKLIILPLVFALCACGGHNEADDHSHHNHGHEAEDHAHHHDHGHSEEDHEHHHHGHEAGHQHGEAKQASANGEITLHKETADAFGVVIDTVASGDFSSAVKAAGVVITAADADAVVSAPTAGIVRFAAGIEPGKALGRGAAVATIDASGVTGGDANVAAKAALDVAKAEYERIETLYKDRLVTVGERNAALAAYNAARAAYSPAAATGKAVSPIAGTITSLAVRQGQYVNAGDLIATVASPGEHTVRIDLPQRHYAQAPTFTDATVVMPYTGSTIRLGQYGGKRIQGTPVASQGAAAYVPLFFSAGNAPGFVAGTTFTAYLLGEPRHNVVSVPSTAISEQQGDFFVYEQLDDECYAKRRVETGATDGMRTEIISGIAPGTRIVGKGVTTVRLAETGSNIPEGHTHNH